MPPNPNMANVSTLMAQPARWYTSLPVAEAPGLLLPVGSPRGGAPIPETTIPTRNRATTQECLNFVDLIDIANDQTAEKPCADDLICPTPSAAGHRMTENHSNVENAENGQNRGGQKGEKCEGFSAQEASSLDPHDPCRYSLHYSYLSRVLLT